MAENAAGNGRKDSTANEIRAQFGQISPADGTETIKTPVLSFSSGSVYIGLKLVSKYDEKKGIREEPVPRLTASFNSHFVELPLNGKWWKEFARFANDMANALEGVSIENVNVNGDGDYAKEMMAKFRNA